MSEPVEEIKQREIAAEIARLKAALAQAERERDNVTTLLSATQHEYERSFAERDLLRAEVERLKDTARTFEARWMTAVNDLARVRAAAQKHCDALRAIPYDEGYAEQCCTELEAALEGRG